MEDEEILKSIYYNVKGPGSFSNSETLLREARKIKPDISRKAVEKFLSQSFVNLKHKPVTKLKKRSTLPVISSGIDNFKTATYFS